MEFAPQPLDRLEAIAILRPQELDCDAVLALHGALAPQVARAVHDGELRDALLPHTLVERTAIAPGYSIDRARVELPKPVYTAWLALIDGSGYARPRTEWAPGKDLDPPVPSRRLSAEWSDPAWLERTGEGLEGAGELRPILERSLAGTRPTVAELESLFRARGPQVEAVALVADRLRQGAVGDTVTYVINRNINYTNQCYFRCGFCAFSKGPRSLNLRGEPYLMSVEQVVHLAEEAVARGATEVTLQGGIHPGFTGDFSIMLSNNHSTGGTCFGDSGGPNFIGNTNVVGGVTSFGINGNCAGTGGVYRVDRADDLNWIYSTFGDYL